MSPCFVLLYSVLVLINLWVPNEIYGSLISDISYRLYLGSNWIKYLELRFKFLVEMI